MSFDEFSFMVRVVTASVWSVLLVRVLFGDVRVWTDLHTGLFLGSIVALLWAIALRGATIVGIIPNSYTAPVMVAATVGVLVVGITLLIPDEEDGQ